MSATRRILARLGATLEVTWVVDDSPRGYRYARRCVMDLLRGVPGLAREARYLSILRRTGGLHASGDDGFSFVLFGFDEPEYGMTSLYEGDPLDSGFFRFGDLMLPAFDDNLVFAFALNERAPTVFATPGSQQCYAPYAGSFEDLVEQLIDLAAQQRAAAAARAP